MQILKSIALYFTGVYYGWQKARLANLKAEVARTRNVLRTGDIRNAINFSNLDRKAKKLEKKVKSTEKCIKQIKKKWKF